MHWNRTIGPAKALNEGAIPFPVFIKGYMMQFYHGTSNSYYVNNIQKEGLIPRGKKSSNWYSQGVESNTEVVYITNNFYYTEFYQFRAALINQDNYGIKLTIENLDEDNLRVDENFISLEELGYSNNCNIDLRHKQQEKILYDSRWKESLDKTSLVSYYGKITSNKIKDVIYTDIRENEFFDEELFSISEKYKRLKFHDCYLSGFKACKNYYYFNKKIPILEKSNGYLEDEFYWWKKGGEFYIKEMKRMDIYKKKC